MDYSRNNPFFFNNNQKQFQRSITLEHFEFREEDKDAQNINLFVDWCIMGSWIASTTYWLTVFVCCWAPAPSVCGAAGGERSAPHSGQQTSTVVLSLRSAHTPDHRRRQRRCETHESCDWMMSPSLVHSLSVGCILTLSVFSGCYSVSVRSLILTIDLYF